MAVHANSVISTRINLWDSVLYIKLTDMEEYCYDSSTQWDDVSETTYAGITEYSPLFGGLNTAIIGWMDRDHTATMDDVLGILAGYMALDTMYDLDNTPLDAINDTAVYTMGGYRTTIKAYGLTYYDDYLYYETANNSLNDDKDAINASGINASPSTTTLIANMQVISKETALDDIPIKGIPDKTASTKYIFDTLGFLESFDNLVMDTKVPSSYYWDGTTLFTDDAEIYFGWKDFGTTGADIQQSSTQAQSGTYSLYNSSGSDGVSPDLGYKILPSYFSIPDLVNGFKIEFDCYKPTAIAGEVTRIGVADSNMNGYNIKLDHGTDEVYINIEKRVTGDAVSNPLATSVTVPIAGELSDVWFKVEFNIYNNGSLVFILKNISDTTLGTVSAVDTTYNLMHYFVYGGSSGQYIDNVVTSLIP